MTITFVRQLRHVKTVGIATLYRFFSRVVYFARSLPQQIRAVVAGEQIIQLNNALGTFSARPFTDTVTKTDPTFESHLHSWVTEAPEGLLIDIGANVGFYTNLALTRGNASGSIAFEPNPSVYPLLVKNISANDLEADAIHAAVSSDSGQLNLAPNTFHTGASTVCGGSGIAIQAVDLDSYLEENGISANEIGCIKIDIEGHELAALEGMQQTLHDLKPGTHLFVEISEYDEPADKTRAFIKWNGFELTEQSGKNYLFIKQ